MYMIKLYDKSACIIQITTTSLSLRSKHFILLKIPMCLYSNVPVETSFFSAFNFVQFFNFILCADEKANVFQTTKYTFYVCISIFFLTYK